MSGAVELPPDWEAVTADDGRVYYWNVDTNETSCALTRIPLTEPLPICAWGRVTARDEFVSPV